MSYSASVAGICPHPRHWYNPSQSPVTQRPRPPASKRQPVRPQRRAFHRSGTVIESEPPGGIVHPVLPDTEPGQAAGQIVTGVRFTSVIVRSRAGVARDVIPWAALAVVVEAGLPAISA